MRPECDRCGKAIEDFNEAGRLGRQWLHKSCWVELWREQRDAGKELPTLSSPASKAPGEPGVLICALLFHFGLCVLLIGWVLVTQEKSPLAGAICLAIGILAPMLGVAGIAYSVYRRRLYESVLAEVPPGSWKAIPLPGNSPEPTA
ncbi:MAG: hypothetical protein WEB00_07475 [Dehalococcoidia bacterium]